MNYQYHNADNSNKWLLANISTAVYQYWLKKLHSATIQAETVNS